MRIISTSAICALLAISVAGTAVAVTKPEKKQVVTGPVAVYWIDTATSSGMTLGGMGAKPSMGQIMNMMKGGDNVSHSLTLKLGSSQTAQGSASGDHLPPTALNGSKDLPLDWKPSKPVAYTPERDSTPSAPDHYEPPKGKILIFWGCGEHAPKNQPVVIDLSKLTDPAARLQMMKQMVPQTTALETVTPPSPSAWKSYGEWPNAKPNGSMGFDGASSLVGAHAIKANYSPDIAFSLDQNQDFLAPVQVSGNSRDAEGAVPLAWNPIARAKGFVVTAFGGGQDTVVMWTSAATQTTMMGMAPQYLTARDVDTLVAQKTVLPGSATGCTVPAEVLASAQGLMYGITAYGGDTTLSYPPRPSNPDVAWNIQWETKIRYRSTTGGMLGRDMGMGAERDQATSDPQTTPPTGDQGKKKKSSLIGNMIKQGVGSFIP